MYDNWDINYDNGLRFMKCHGELFDVHILSFLQHPQDVLQVRTFCYQQSETMQIQCIPVHFDILSKFFIKKP